MTTNAPEGRTLTYLCPAPTPTGPCHKPLPCKGHLIDTPNEGMLLYGSIYLKPTDVRGDDLPFRRRCGWCAVPLRAWQLNLCQTCKPAVLGSPSPPCGEGARWAEKPDARPRWMRRRAR